LSDKRVSVYEGTESLNVLCDQLHKTEVGETAAILKLPCELDPQEELLHPIFERWQ